MVKITTDPLNNSYGSTATINNNFDKITTDLNTKVLYRDNPDGETNQMENDLDMNLNRIHNLPTALEATEPVTYQQFLDESAAGTGIALDSEEIIATSGQTVFNFSEITYIKGIENLSVYSEGLRQPPSTFTETSATSITLDTPATLGDHLYFVVGEPVTTTVTQASSVTYRDTNVSDQLNDTPKVFDTVATMKVSSPLVGDVVQTKAYYAAGGGATYLVAAAQTVDGYGDHTLANGNVALLQVDTIRAELFGVTGTGDESLPIQAAIDRAKLQGKGFVDLLPDEYTATGLTDTDVVKFRGKGAVFSDITYRVLGESAQRFNVPTGFTALPFTDYTVDAIGNVDVDVEQLWLDNEVQGIVPYYVDWVNGSDSNNGSQPNAPYKTINKAAQQVDVGIIYLLPGTHYDGLDNFKPTRDIEIRSFSGDEVIIRMGEDPGDYTFTVTATTAYEYETTISRTVTAVFDETLPDGRGGYREMTEEASIVAVNALPGSWYYDGAKLYVRMFTNRAPGTDLVIITTSVNALDGDQAIFLRDVKIEGGNHGFQLTATSTGTLIPRLYMQDCRIFYAQNFGIDSNGGKTYLERVEIVDSAGDNLNYSDQDAASSVAVEIDVISRGAGQSQATETNNASSMHGDGIVGRINGDYSESYGPTIPDTDAVMSLNIGVTARNSIAPTAGQNVNFLNGQGTNGGTMYCHRCLSEGSVTDYYATTSDIFVAECSDQEVFSEPNASSHVMQYWPDDKV